MSVLDILHFPDPRLRQQAEAVTCFDAALRTLVADLFETMYAADGVGLAATQVNRHLRVLVADCSGEHSAPLALINPRLVAHDGRERHEEGCLSIPGIREEVERAGRIVVEAQDPHGQALRLEADGLLAICIQHEMDHLRGKLFIDHLSTLKRGRIKKRLLGQREPATA
jgi:peptide deformylase